MSRDEQQYSKFPNPDLLDVSEHFKDLTVIFVTSGYEVPYIPLERGITDSLKRIVRHLYVVSPEQNLLWIAQKTKPDLILVFGGFETPCDQIEELQKAHIKTAIWMTDDPYFTDKTKQFAPSYNFIFTQEVNCIAFYQTLGCKNIHYLPLGADSSVFHPKKVSPKCHTDILFVGVAYENRLQLFDEIAAYLANKKTIICGFGWDKLKSYRLLKGKVYPNYWMKPEETAQYYNGAKIVLNMHRKYDDRAVNKNSQEIEASSINPRTFEISACGAFQLTDIRPELSSFYTIGYDIETYSSTASLIEKMDYYLHHEEERKIIAARALKNIQQHHTFLHRVLELLKNVFPNKD